MMDNVNMGDLGATKLAYMPGLRVLEIRHNDELCINQASKSFLQLFQNRIGSRFTLRDVCTYYTGLPYLFEIYLI